MKQEKKIAIVTGGAGFIGPHIVTELLAQDFEPHDTLADNTRAKELLGWEPSVSLEDGIAELKKEFRL